MVEAVEEQVGEEKLEGLELLEAIIYEEIPKGYSIETQKRTNIINIYKKSLISLINNIGPLLIGGEASSRSSDMYAVMDKDSTNVDIFLYDNNLFEAAKKIAEKYRNETGLKVRIL